MKCAIFNCVLLATENLIGDDRKEILLCLAHYKFVKRVMENRFKND